MKTMKALINFLFEVGMLKKTPRTGYQFLGSGQESVAEHSFLTAVLGYLLSRHETDTSERFSKDRLQIHDGTTYIPIPW